MRRNRLSLRCRARSERICCSTVSVLLVNPLHDLRAWVLALASEFDHPFHLRQRQANAFRLQDEINVVVRLGTDVTVHLVFGTCYEQLVRIRRIRHALWSRHPRYAMDDSLGTEVKNLFRIVANAETNSLLLGSNPKWSMRPCTFGRGMAPVKTNGRVAAGVELFWAYTWVANATINASLRQLRETFSETRGRRGLPAYSDASMTRDSHSGCSRSRHAMANERETAAVRSYRQCRAEGGRRTAGTLCLPIGHRVGGTGDQRHLAGQVGRPDCGYSDSAAHCLKGREAMRGKTCGCC
jgi:hypothetical protein